LTTRQGGRFEPEFRGSRHWARRRAAGALSVHLAGAGAHARKGMRLHACLLLLALSVWAVACVTPAVHHLEVVWPFRFQLQYAPAWFGTIVLPPGRVTAELQYAGDACDTLLGRYPVRGKVALIDRGKCSFVQKVRIRDTHSPSAHGAKERG